MGTPLPPKDDDLIEYAGKIDIRRPAVRFSRKELLFQVFLHVNRELDDFQRYALGLVFGPEADAKSIEEARIKLCQKITILSAADWKPSREPGDQVHTPNHYDRLPMEPTYFLVETGGAHWCLENYLKYVCRFRWKNGIEDLQKALRNLSMYLRWREGDEGWSR